MHGLMMDTPLLISSIARHAENFHGDREIVSVTMDNPRHRYRIRDAVARARRLANALGKLGLERGDRVAILSKNCAEWLIADVAISMAGLVSVPIYPTAGTGTIRYVLEHSGASAVIVGRLDDPAPANEAIPSGVATIGMRYDEGDRQHEWQAMIDEITAIYQSEHAYVPMYVQPLVWGARDNIELTQRPDNFFILRWVTVN